MIHWPSLDRARLGHPLEPRAEQPLQAPHPRHHSICLRLALWKRRHHESFIRRDPALSRHWSTRILHAIDPGANRSVQAQTIVIWLEHRALSIDHVLAVG